MYQAIQWSPSAGLENGKKVKGKGTTPGDIGEILFHHILKRIGRSFYKKDGGLTLQETDGPIRKSSQKDQNQDTNPLLRLNEKIRQLGIPTSQLVFPESAIPQLIRFFENQGLSEEQVSQLIQTSKMSDGSLRVDPFLPYLTKQGLEAEGQNLVIQSKDTPRLEEIFFRMGLGAGEIKEIMEKGVRSDGDMDLGQISMALSEYRGGHSEQDLISLLHHFDIKDKPKIIDTKGLEPELKEAFTKFSQTPSQDAQQTIKQNISAFLIRKGIPPQEVKSFLEGLNIQYAKTTLKTTSPQPLESNVLFNQVTISNQSVWQKWGWDDKILAILQGERVIVAKDVNKDPFEQKGEYRVNVTELQKHGGDTKPKGELFQEMSLNKQMTHTTETIQRVKNAGESKASTLPKEGFITDLAALKTETEPSRIGALDQPKPAVNLPQPLPKIIDRMMWMMRAGEQQGRIVINPPELGRLDLDISIKHGHVHAYLNAENHVVKELIEANIGQLRQQLSDQGFVVEKLEVMVGLDDQREKENGMWTGHGRKRNRNSQSKGDEKIVETMGVKNGATGSLENKLYQIDVHV